MPQKKRLRKVRVTLDLELDESLLADLAVEAMQTRKSVSALIRDRLLSAVHITERPEGTARKKRVTTVGRARIPRGGGPAYHVRDFAHLFNQPPPGQKPYRGSGRPPEWLIQAIEDEIAAGRYPAQSSDSDLS